MEEQSQEPSLQLEWFNVGQYNGDWGEQDEWNMPPSTNSKPECGSERWSNQYLTTAKDRVTGPGISSARSNSGNGDGNADDPGSIKSWKKYEKCKGESRASAGDAPSPTAHISAGARFGGTATHREIYLSKPALKASEIKNDTDTCQSKH